MAKRKYISLDQLETKLTDSMPTDITSKRPIKIFPCFYVDNARILIPDKKIGKEVEAEVKILIRSKKIKGRENERAFDYEFEMRAIRFPEGQKDERHIQQRIEDELSAAKEK